jgi:hypothetical protein
MLQSVDICHQQLLILTRPLIIYLHLLILIHNQRLVQ